MLPGPTLIYSCPKCGRKVANESLMSGNTFGARFYSDGKREAFMLPEFPDLVSCGSCGNFFFLSQQTPVDELFDYEEQTNSETEDIDQAAFLDIAELERSLGHEVAAKKENEIVIRLQIWRAFNDRTRSGRAMFGNIAEEELWQENCEHLLQLIEPTAAEHIITLAELNRNLGRFEESLHLLEKLNGKEWKNLKQQFIKACKNKQKEVFELESKG